MRFQIKKYGRKNAYATCPKHKDKHPSLAIDIHGQYAGCFHCFSCNYSGKLSKEELQELKRNAGMKKLENPTPINWTDVAAMYARYCPPEFLSERWNVCPDILYDLGIGFDGEAAIIPMYNELGRKVGIQRQFPDGKKCCIEGSQLGLFIPFLYGEVEKLFITEGCSDCACILDLGFHAIGRASAGTCQDMAVKWVESNIDISVPVFTIADNDEAGIKAAKSLGYDIYIPEQKDIRKEIKVKGKETIKKILEEL